MVARAADTPGRIGETPLPTARGAQLQRSPSPPSSDGVTDCGAASSWFRFGGDTYLAIDNDLSAAFVTGRDQVVRLEGEVDLSGATITDTQLLFA